MDKRQLFIKACEAPMVLHHEVSSTSVSSYIWKQDNTAEFTEFILTWNGFRPREGGYLFSISIRIEDEWSSWLPYMFWGVSSQRSFDVEGMNGRIKIFQDILEIRAGKANGFQIKVESQFADLHLKALHVCLSNPSYFTHLRHSVDYLDSSFEIKMKGISQLALNHERNMSFCSPSSVTALLNTFLPKQKINPLSFVSEVWDEGFDIYGNWVLNVAQAFNVLGDPWRCWVSRLSSFGAILESLNKNIPVITSIKGSIKGSFLPYTSGHLIVVRGYDAESQQVLCMDPAYPKDEQTLVKYSLSEFLIAWAKKGNITYIFKNRTAL